jgi:hypothetical protein
MVSTFPALVGHCAVWMHHIALVRDSEGEFDMLGTLRPRCFHDAPYTMHHFLHVEGAYTMHVKNRLGLMRGVHSVTNGGIGAQ